MRAGYLDALRGIAVLWMIIFHTAYDMRLLGFLDWDFSEGFWFGFPRVIAFTFLFCVGISLNYTHRPRINWAALSKRLLKIGAAAILISVGTYFAFPTHWIFFGTLHSIFVGSLLGALMVNHRRLALVLMISIIVGQYFLNYDIRWVSNVIRRPSMDFIPIYPWFWTILAGILIGPYLSRNERLECLRPPKLLNFLGRHALKIYLLHQPLIYGALLGAKKLL